MQKRMTVQFRPLQTSDRNYKIYRPPFYMSHGIDNLMLIPIIMFRNRRDQCTCLFRYDVHNSTDRQTRLSQIVSILLSRPVADTRGAGVPKTPNISTNCTRFSNYFYKLYEMALANPFDEKKLIKIHMCLEKKTRKV